MVKLLNNTTKYIFFFFKIHTLQTFNYEIYRHSKLWYQVPHPSVV